MTGDDLVLDLVVGSLGENAAGDELVLGSVGTAVDDALGVSVADAGKGLELVGGGGVDIEQAAAVAAGGLGVWATLKTGAMANRRAVAKSLRRRLSMRTSPWTR